VINALEDLTERALSDALLYLKTIGDLVMDFTEVLAFVIIEA